MDAETGHTTGHTFGGGFASMNDTLQRELRLVAWILQAPKERHPIIERHLNHGAAIETPFLRTVYQRIGDAKGEVSDESLIAEYGAKRFDAIGGTERFRSAVLEADYLFHRPQAEHLAASILEQYRRRTAAQLLEAAAAEYRSGSQSFVEIEADLDRKLSEFRQYNPAADELVRSSEWLDAFPNIPREPVSPILSGLWSRGEWAYLTGRAGKGKSWMGFTLIDAIKGGRKFLGFDTHGADMRIGIITPEIGPDEVQARFQKLSGGTLHPGLALFHKQNLPAGFDLGMEQTRRAVLRWIDDLGLELIVVDPLTACYHGQLWGPPIIPLIQFFFDLPRLTRTGCGLLLIHHESENDRDGKPTGRGMGASELDQRPRLNMSMGERNGRARLVVKKCNAWSGPTLPKLFLDIDPSTGRWIASDLPDASGAKAERLQKIHTHIEARGSITTKQVMDLCGVKIRSAQTYLEDLGAMPSGKGQGTVWTIPQHGEAQDTEKSANEDLPF